MIITNQPGGADGLRSWVGSAGYTVNLTKSSANENVRLLERVREAIDDHATIAVSLHYTGGIRFGEPNAHFGVTPQQVGRYRTNVTNGHTIRFRNACVAAESQRDARITLLPATGSMSLRLMRASPSLAVCQRTANISIVKVVDQRFLWIYNEDGDIGFNFRDYTTGIANGIERAVPIAACLRPHPEARRRSPRSRAVAVPHDSFRARAAPGSSGDAGVVRRRRTSASPRLR